jgi:hypothetical protein
VECALGVVVVDCWIATVILEKRARAPAVVVVFVAVAVVAVVAGLSMRRMM